MNRPPKSRRLGAIVEEGGVRFRVFAPGARHVDLVLEQTGVDKAMARRRSGHFELFVRDLGPNALYRYRLDRDQAYPDPASRFQPEGVHGPSMVVDPTYSWRDADWQGIKQSELVFYELHVGTFTSEGTFAAVESKLGYLSSLGITAIELMPVADFPGRWNWGYDPAALFAPCRAYGKPDDLRRLVDAAHGKGLAVYLDVVYNHFGPDGAYALAFAPEIFSERHHTPWGKAMNLDGDFSPQVRGFFLDNARHWLEEYHFDGFRMDATFALIDDSETHFLAELVDVVRKVPGSPRLLVAEDDRNWRRVIEPRESGGYGLDAQWADDFHHQVRVNLAGDKHGYYRDYQGLGKDIARTVEQGWYYTGQFSEHAGKYRGTTTVGLPPERFVFCIQNHDQIGNRPFGNRITEDVSYHAYRAATALLLFAPQLPLMFMGQEWAASTPFQYFTDHHDELGKLVSQGRRQEFKDFPGFSGEVPDPQEERTFFRSKLDWGERESGVHKRMLDCYRDLLLLRKKLSGPVKAVSPVADGVELERGRHLLQVALRKGVRLTRPEGRRKAWTSEDAAYAEEPAPPEVAENEVYFPVPAAILWEAAD